MTVFEHIAVGVDGHETGRDAACLGAMIAGATGSDMLLVAVLPEWPLLAPRRMDRIAMHEHAELRLRELRDFMAPDARTVVETDWSVPRALERVARREQQDLLVVGSSRHASPGHARIGRRTRQLLGDAGCALAIAPRDLCAGGPRSLVTIGVGYDGGQEARAALTVAGQLSRASGARLSVRAVLDDRLPYLGWPAPRGTPMREVQGEVQGMWDEAIKPELESLREDAQLVAASIVTDAVVDARCGSPPDELLALSGEVDLLLIGSRRWGSAGRILLGSTGEAVLHDARCSVMVVPRPHE